MATERCPLAQHSTDWHGTAMAQMSFGMAWHGHGTDVLWHGMARTGTAWPWHGCPFWPGTARHALARHGNVGPGMFQYMAQHVSAQHGMAWGIADIYIDIYIYIYIINLPCNNVKLDQRER